jgi:hypothetical protein
MTDFVQNYSWYSVMVRDVGPYNVEFWWRANDQTIHYYPTSLHFTINVNGSDSHFAPEVFPYSDWVQIAVFNVPYTQYVSFTVDGWDTFTVHILRSVPDPPSHPTLSNVQVHSADVYWSPGYAGSSPITGYQVGYGISSSGPTTTVSVSSPSYTATGLAMGTIYYFWVRAQNGLGYSAWSASNSVRTLTGAYVNVGGVWKVAIPYVNVAGVWKQAEPSVTRF